MEEMKKPINISADSSWLSDMEMVDEYILSDKDCNLNLNLLDADEEQELLSHDIASVFGFEEQRETLQQCLNTECISTTLSETFTDETSFESFDNFDFDFEKPNKQLKTTGRSDNDNNIIENFALKSSNSPYSYQLPQILCFDNPNPTEFYVYDQKQNEIVTSASLRNRKFSVQNSKGSSKESRARRSPAHIKDHIMAERKRRQKLSQSFIALAALIPNLKKMDKATILAETIKYVKELKERLEILENKGKKPKPDVCNDNHYSSSNESSETESAAGGTSTESLFKVEARVSGQHMLIRIHCKKHNGLLVKIITEIQSFELFVINNSVLAFEDSILDITIIAEIGEGYNLTIKELVNNLRMVALKFMSV